MYDGTCSNDSMLRALQVSRCRVLITSLCSKTERRVQVRNAHRPDGPVRRQHRDGEGSVTWTAPSTSPHTVRPCCRTNEARETLTSECQTLASSERPTSDRRCMHTSYSRNSFPDPRVMRKRMLWALLAMVMPDGPPGHIHSLIFMYTQ